MDLLQMYAGRGQARFDMCAYLQLGSELTVLLGYHINITQNFTSVCNHFLIHERVKLVQSYISF